MHQTILVTGATGTVGKEVVIQLCMQNDVRVRAGVHSLVKGDILKRLPGAEIVEMDFDHPESMKAAFTHVDKVFLITPSGKDQVGMAKNLVDQAKKAGVKHIVKLSAMGAGEQPELEMTRWHTEIEHYIEASGVPYTFLRASSFMQNFIIYDSESIKQEGKLYQSIGDGKVAYIDVRDIAAVGVEALTGAGHEGKIYKLTGPEALSDHDIASILQEVTGKPVQYVDVPEEEARQIMLQHMPEWLVDALQELNRHYKAGWGNKVTDTVAAVTGKAPHTMRQFVQDNKDCFV